MTNIAVLALILFYFIAPNSPLFWVATAVTFATLLAETVKVVRTWGEKEWVV